MKDFVPLLQTLVWPIFILILIYLGRQKVFGILEAIRLRIEAGDPFEAGTSGVKLGRSSSIDSTQPSTATSPEPSTIDSTKLEELPKEEITSEDNTISYRQDYEPENPGIYLVHRARRDKSLDQGDMQYYRLRLFLEADPDVDLDQVSKVVYHLHPTFPNPERVVTEPDTQFEVDTSAWGQFNLIADVYLKGQKVPLRLERYLNF